MSSARFQNTDTTCKTQSYFIHKQQTVQNENFKNSARNGMKNTIKDVGISLTKGVQDLYTENMGAQHS